METRWLSITKSTLCSGYNQMKSSFLNGTWSYSDQSTFLALGWNRNKPSANPFAFSSLNQEYSTTRDSLVTQWHIIHLPMQETQVQPLVQGDSTCQGATKPVYRNYWACALEPRNRNHWSPRSLDPVLCNKRGHCNEKPTPHN